MAQAQPDERRARPVPERRSEPWRSEPRRPVLEQQSEPYRPTLPFERWSALHQARPVEGRPKLQQAGPRAKPVPERKRAPQRATPVPERKRAPQRATPVPERKRARQQATRASDRRAERMTKQAQRAKRRAISLPPCRRVEPLDARTEPRAWSGPAPADRARTRWSRLGRSPAGRSLGSADPRQSRSARSPPASGRRAPNPPASRSRAGAPMPGARWHARGRARASWCCGRGRPRRVARGPRGRCSAGPTALRPEEARVEAGAFGSARATRGAASPTSSRPACRRSAARRWSRRGCRRRSPEGHRGRTRSHPLRR
jgi:hypothetical protein